MKQYNLLIPGRHHVLTNFQYQELTRLTNKNLCDILDVNKVCVPQTTAAEVTAQRAILSGLTARISGPQVAPNEPLVRVNGLQFIVAEGEAVIAQVKTMTGSIRDTSVIAGKVSAYLTKHSYAEQRLVREELYTTTDRATQLSTLQDVQSRFAQCKSRIDLMAAPSS